MARPPYLKSKYHDIFTTIWLTVTKFSTYDAYGHFYVKLLINSNFKKSKIADFAVVKMIPQTFDRF